MAERQRRISYVMIVDFATFLVSTSLTIGAALVFRSYWGLIAGMYAGSAANAVFSYLFYPGGRHRIVFDKHVGRELWLFARVVIFSSIITLLLGQADKIFIGRRLTLEDFGLYMLAGNVISAAMRLVYVYVQKVFFPLLAATAREAPQTLHQVYYGARWRMTASLSFILGGVVGGGPLAVRILFDDRYLAAGVFVSLLALQPLFSLVSQPAEQLAIVKGRIRSALEANIVRLIWIVCAAPLGFHFFGTVGLVAAFALIEAAASVYWWIRLRNFKVLDLGHEALPMGAALLGGLIGYGLYQLAEELIRNGTLPAF